MYIQVVHTLIHEKQFPASLMEAARILGLFNRLKVCSSTNLRIHFINPLKSLACNVFVLLAK